MTEANKNNNLTEVDEDFSHWQLPDVSQPKTDNGSNLFGQLGRQNSQPVAEDKPLLPPTMAEIEQIRVEAEQEGFEQGQLDGLAKGTEQGRLEGLEQGHAEGFSQGEQQGYEVGLAKANEMLERLSGLVEQFEQPLLVLDAEIEAELLQLSINLAKSIVSNELQTHPEHILSVLRQGVDSLPIKKQQVTLRFNPADAELVNQLYSEAQLAKNRWEIEADPSLNNGDCVIHSERSSVDLRVEARMTQALSGLQQQVAGIQANVQAIKSDSSRYTTSIVDEASECSLTVVGAEQEQSTAGNVSAGNVSAAPNEESLHLVDEVDDAKSPTSIAE